MKSQRVQGIAVGTLSQILTHFAVGALFLGRSSVFYFAFELVHVQLFVIRVMPNYMLMY